ncbi:MAG TPA: HPr family phosphocarrier protein [bacterium]|nr:HPr family phosphocarrier protein [bacterium]
MTAKEVLVRTGVGLHARPAAILVAAARPYACRVMIEYNGRVVDAKSITQVLGLGVPDQATVILRTDGEREEEVLAALAALFERGLPQTTSESP